jgi:hypothetical protein
MLSKFSNLYVGASSEREGMKGSVLVEAVIVMLLFLAFVGAVIYWALTLHYRQMLTDGMTVTLRRISANVNQVDYPNPTYSADVLTAMSGGGPGSSSIGKQVIDYLQQKKMIPRISNLAVQSMTICKDTTSGDCRMRMKMSYSNPCYLCIFIGLTSVEVQVESGIEDPCFRTDTMPATGRGCFANLPSCL